MPTHIQPFTGLRYSPRHVADLSVVMTPPYDVISPQERAAYLASHPYNMIHLILGEERASDTTTDNRFTRAAATLQQWRQTGVLQAEAQPALYVYQQDFLLEGSPKTRTGVISRVRLEEYEAGVIFPHETTFAGPKADLLQLWQACRANLSQIFSVYHDTAHTVEATLAPVVAQPPQVEVAQWGEGSHRLWVVTDPSLIASVQQSMREKPLVIADGHHRYETSLALRDLLRQQPPDAGEAAPYEYVMMYCANIADPGVVALPTHRLLQPFPAAQLETVLQQLCDWVQVEVETRPAPDLDQWQQQLLGRLREYDAPGNIFVLYAGGDRCYVVTVTPQAARQRVGPAEASDAWKQLDVSVLHHALLPALQQAAAVAEPTITYARAGDEVLRAVERGACDVAILMRPTPLEQMVTVAMGGERMPQKSTYFYPKLPTGLVVHSFT
jgi:uncharacterized protein (DUF1015 family)